MAFLGLKLRWTYGNLQVQLPMLLLEPQKQIFFKFKNTAPSALIDGAGLLLYCLFNLILYILVNIFSVMSGWVFLC